MSAVEYPDLVRQFRVTGVPSVCSNASRSAPPTVILYFVRGAVAPWITTYDPETVIFEFAIAGWMVTRSVVNQPPVLTLRGA